MKNKKASIFPGFLVVITLVLLAAAFGTFIYMKTKIQTEVSPNSDLIKLYNERDEVKLFNNELLKLKAEQAYSDVMKQGAVKGEKCVVREEYAEWNNNCNPNIEEIKEMIEEKTNARITKDILYQKKDNITKTIEIKGFTDYNVTYTYNPSASVNLSEIYIYFEDFNDIFKKINDCRLMNIEDTEACMKTKFENWDTKIKKTDNYIFYNLTSNKKYFHDNEFSYVILKFVIKSWFI